MNIRIPKEEIRKVLMIKKFIMTKTIDAIKECFVGKLQKVLVNLAHISTHNPLWVDINTYLFYYFFQVSIHLGKQNKHPYVDDKLL